MRNQKGITLVALVVTIVVLLILAGVSIAMLAGDDGIITNAQKSKAANTEGEVMDKVKMAYNAMKTEVIAKSAVDSEYDPQAATTELALAQVVVDELGLTGTLAAGTALTGNGYSILYTASTSSVDGTIVVTYSDTAFTLDVDADTDTTDTEYEKIVMTITIESDDVTLSDYTRQTI